MHEPLCVSKRRAFNATPAWRLGVLLSIAFSLSGFSVGCGGAPQPVVVATPTFAPTPGSYATAQLVTLADNAEDRLYFTTNGTTPTQSSTPYTEPILVLNNTTFNAIAVAPESATSAVSSASYTIEPPASAPLVHWDNQVSKIRQGQVAQARLCFVGDSITSSNVTITPLKENLTAPLGDGGWGWLSLMNQPLDGHYQDKDAPPLDHTTHVRPYLVPQSPPFTISVSRPPDQEPGTPGGDSYLDDVSAQYASTGARLISATVQPPVLSSSTCNLPASCTLLNSVAYTYVVVADLPGGVSISPARSILGPSTLDGSHFVEVTTSSLPAARNCSVYRTAGGKNTGEVGTAMSCGSVFRDEGNTLTGIGQPVPAPNIPPGYYAVDVDTGLYQFNAADAGKLLQLTYTVWGMTIATGSWTDTYNLGTVVGRGADGTETNTADPQATMSLVCPKSDTIKVFYLKQPGGGGFTYNVDNGSAVSVNTANATPAVGMIDIAGLSLASAQHQWNFAMSAAGSTGVTLLGASCQTNSIPGARIEKLAQSGTRADVMNDIPANLYSNQLQDLDCDLVMIRFSANERASCLTTGCTGTQSVAPGQFNTNLQNLYGTIHAALPNSDIAFESENDNYVPDALYTMQEYTNAMQAAAQDNNTGWIDSFGLMSPYSRIASLGLTNTPGAPPSGEDLHPSKAGGKIIADYEASFLLP